MTRYLTSLCLLAVVFFPFAQSVAETASENQNNALKELEKALSKGEDDLSSTTASSGQLKRALFTTLVEQYEPTDNIDTISRSHAKMYFFTELLDFKNKTIRHRWEYNGRVMAEIPIEVTSNKFRVHTSKNIPAYALGEWTVIVTDDAGLVLTRKTIQVTE